MLYFVRISSAILAVFLLLQCRSYSRTMQGVKTSFYGGKFDSAADTVRTEFQDSANRDRLLWLMEAGIIFHSGGDYRKSITVFEEADGIADTFQASISNKAASFLLNDARENFRGESYEHVLIKYYLALNHILIKDYEGAKRYLRKLNYTHQEMKLDEDTYRQNITARYLDALVSEYERKYNDARVQYKNIEKLAGANPMFAAGRYVLAVKEGDAGDIGKYRSGAEDVLAFNADMKKTKYSPDMGELIVINQAGKAATKASRGKIADSPEFQTAFEKAIRAVAEEKGAAASVGAMLLVVGQAENPIPVYQKNGGGEERSQSILINGSEIAETVKLFDYSHTAIRNFNDNYSGLVAKNAGSIAVKFVVGYLAAEVAARVAKERAGSALASIPFADKLIDVAAGATVGAGIAATIKPDLRCWSLLPANIQMQRIFLLPGEYTLRFLIPGSEGRYTNPISVHIEKGKPYFVNLRSIYTESPERSQASN